MTCILDDAKVYTNHAKKKIIDLDDVKLASQLVLDKSFSNPPPRDVRSRAQALKPSERNVTNMFDTYLPTGVARIGPWTQHCATSADQTTLRSAPTAGSLLPDCGQLQTEGGRSAEEDDQVGHRRAVHHQDADQRRIVGNDEAPELRSQCQNAERHHPEARLQVQQHSEGDHRSGQAKVRDENGD